MQKSVYAINQESCWEDIHCGSLVAAKPADAGLIMAATFQWGQNARMLVCLHLGSC